MIDTAPMSLDEIIAEYVRATEASEDVARLHSGDLSIWSAFGEQARRLDELGIAYTVTPGVPAFAAVSAALRKELTVPEVAQSLVLTRTQGRASSMPERENLRTLAAARSDNGDSPLDSRNRARRLRIDAGLRSGLSGRDRLSRLVAG